MVTYGMESEALDGITRFRLNDQITSRIRQQILSGNLQPGVRMAQVEWAKRLGTSRMPVRDAFLRLQSEGFLTLAEGGVAHVAHLSEQDIRDAYELGAFAGALVAKRATRNMTPAVLNELDQVHASYVAAVDAHDVDRAYSTNHQFHRLLNLQCRQPRLLAMLRVLTAGMPHVGILVIPEWRQRTIDSHAAILDALRAGDVERVGELMSRHVFEAADVVTAYLRERGFWDPATEVQH